MDQVMALCIANILSMCLILKIERYLFEKKIEKMKEDFEEFCKFRVHCSENSVRANFEKERGKEREYLREITVNDIYCELYKQVDSETKRCFNALKEKESKSNRIEVIFKTEED